MITLIDSSAWIDYFRDADSQGRSSVRRVLADDEAATTDAVRLEVLAGTYRGPTLRELTSFLDGCHDLGQLARVDVESAVQIYHRCRRAGETVRSLNDCLIAAVALRHEVPVLHNDRDFDVIAEFSDLRVLRA
ncbi:PIN domain nuclease [uncultured Jatrophihabitans sp.]|uniref:type II toxin-antitoxin system VapC family toxin n=1 Tax=uncultured Jatrophihabitans sp. TaxID=1610747 RepID=UPI0035CB80A8